MFEVSYITHRTYIFSDNMTPQEQEQNQLEYVHPEVLVDTQWTEDHLTDPKVRIAEVDYDSSSNYKLGHIPESVLFEWRKDINEPLSRNILTRQAFEELLQKAGINNDTTLILYGDFNNWFAACLILNYNQILLCQTLARQKFLSQRAQQFVLGIRDIGTPKL